MEFRQRPLGFMKFSFCLLPDDCCFVKKNSMKPRGHSLNSIALYIYIYIYIYIFIII